MSRATFLVMSDFERLEEWGAQVGAIFRPAHGPFLVGSVLERPDFRDVDVRVIVPDRQFDREYGKRPLKVRMLNRAISVWGQRETGLPIDFQLQRMTEANAEFSGRRNPLGVRDWTTIPTSGVPTP